jgi:hypothetical protein
VDGRHLVADHSLRAIDETNLMAPAWETAAAVEVAVRALLTTQTWQVLR